MNAAVRRPGDNKIGATFLFSLLVHGLLLFGIGIGYVATRPTLPTLDVTLVNVANNDAPDKADFLAQANNQGGGDSDKASKPSQPFSGLLPVPTNGTAPQDVAAATPSPQQATAKRMLTTAGRSSFNVNSDSAKVERDTPTSDADEAQVERQAAQLAAEVSKESQAYAKRPHKKFINANTAEYAYAAYMHGWVNRIERVGNLNYPEQARDQHIHGDVLLTVGLNRDGSINSIDVTQSSGYAVIDNAAEAIVRLCAPFPPLPADKSRVDILYITRTWQFQPGDVLKTR